MDATAKDSELVVFNINSILIASILNTVLITVRQVSLQTNQLNQEKEEERKQKSVADQEEEEDAEQEQEENIILSFAIQRQC